MAASLSGAMTPVDWPLDSGSRLCNHRVIESLQPRRIRDGGDRMNVKALRWLLGLLALIAVIRPAVAAPAPDDTAAFTQYVRDAMAQADPGAKVVTKGPLWLGVSIRGAGEHSVYLSNIAGACTRDR